MKMWDGRFSGSTDELMDAFNSSLNVDKELIEQDIAVNIAWAEALHKAGVLDDGDAASVVSGLRGILEEYVHGTLSFDQSDEDIHMAVERLLTERVGEAGARIHTGRSRNDQVVTDFRLYVKKALGAIDARVTELQNALLGCAERDQGVVAPGYTHLQQAQPVLLAHYWLSFFWALQREKDRLGHAICSADILPLGSGALAGAGVAVDRQLLANKLGFSRVSENSIDAVASRDFALEALSCIASLGILCSRYAEDLIIWSSREFGFVELDDAWSTGSSMMPQKKNPDSLELIRGKSARFLSNYTRLATTLKGVGLAYYKDLQEDKEAFFDSAAQIGLVVTVFSRVIGTLKVRAERVRGALDPFLLATDLADYLVGKGMPFREAHNVVGKVVAFCTKEEKQLDKIATSDLRRFSDRFDDGVAEVLSWRHAIGHRDVEGGTGGTSVAKQIKDARKLLASSAESDG